MTHPRLQIKVMKDSRYFPKVAYLDVYDDVKNVALFPPFASLSHPADFFAYRTFQGEPRYEDARTIPQDGRRSPVQIRVGRTKDTFHIGTQTHQSEKGIHFRCPKCRISGSQFFFTNEKVGCYVEPLLQAPLTLNSSGQIEVEFRDLLPSLIGISQDTFINYLQKARNGLL